MTYLKMGPENSRKLSKKTVSEWVSEWEKEREPASPREMSPFPWQIYPLKDKAVSCLGDIWGYKDT